MEAAVPAETPSSTVHGVTAHIFVYFLHKMNE
jgi:hypothetical protein